MCECETGFRSILVQSSTFGHHKRQSTANRNIIINKMFPFLNSFDCMNPIHFKATLLVSAILQRGEDICFAIVVVIAPITTIAAAVAKVSCVCLFKEFQIFSKSVCLVFPPRFSSSKCAEHKSSLPAFHLNCKQFQNHSF